MTEPSLSEVKKLHQESNVSMRETIVQVAKDYSKAIGKENEDDIYDFGKVIVVRLKGRDYVYLKSDFIISLVRARHEAKP